MDILVIGNFDLIIAVLNGVANLTANGGFANGNYVMLAMIIGVLVIVARAVVTQKLEIQWFFVSVVMYLALFVPKVTVTVEDIYTGATNNVANVPVGLAAIGHVVSQVGVGLTDAFGTIFTAPSLTGEGYLDSLELLLAMRDVPLSGANDGVAGGSADVVDYKKTLENYMKDCVIKEIHSVASGPRLTMQQIVESSDLLTTINVNRPAWFTTVHMPGSPEEGAVASCPNAYAQINTFTTTTLIPAWCTVIEDMMGIGANCTMEIQGALDTIVGVGKSAQHYMQNVLIFRAVEYARMGYDAEWDNTAGVIMRTQAMEQRRVQWSAEQSLFLEVARPMMAYIEAFFYAISPFMIFLLMLGAWGFTLFVKYLLLAVWIQLWMPMMAINQLYISTVASRDLQDLDTSTNVLSMVGMTNMWTDLATWVSVGGMMASATPLLALIVLTGSYYSMTSLTNKMGGQDHLDEKLAAPDIGRIAPMVEIGAGLNAMARETRSPVHGRTATGAADVIPDISASQMYTRMVESGHSLQESATTQWQQSMAERVSSMTRNELSAVARESEKGTFATSRSSVDRVLDAQAAELTEGMRFSESDEYTARAALMGALSGGGGTSGKVKGFDTFIRGMLQQSLSDQTGISSQQVSELARRATERISEDNELKEEQRDALSSDVENGVTASYSTMTGVTSDEGYQRARSEMAQAQETYRETDNLRGGFGVDLKMDAGAFGHQAVRQGLMPELLRMATDHGVMHDAQGWAGRFGSAGPNGEPALIYDDEQALAAGIGLAMANAASGGDINAATDFAGFVGDHISPTSEVGDAYGNAGIGGGAPGSGDVRTGADSNVHGPGVSAADVRREQAEGAERIGNSVAGSRAKVSGTADRSRDQVRESARQLRAAQQVTHAEQLWDRVVEEFDAIRGMDALVEADWTKAIVNAGVQMGNMVYGGVVPVEASPEKQEAYEQAYAAGVGGPAADYYASYAAGEPNDAAEGAMGEALGEDEAQVLVEILERARTAENPDLMLQAASQGAILVDHHLAEKKSHESVGGGARTPTPPEFGRLRDANVTGGAEGDILDLIAGPEAQGNYNALYGAAGQTAVDITRMAARDMWSFQQQLVAERGGSVLGRYQFLDDTLADLFRQEGVAENELLSPALQDRLALRLTEDAGLNEWMAGRRSHADFAHRLSRIWAALPRDESGLSYHEGTAGNHALVSWDAVIDRLEEIRGGGEIARGAGVDVLSSYVELDREDLQEDAPNLYRYHVRADERGGAERRGG